MSPWRRATVLVLVLTFSAATAAGPALAANTTSTDQKNKQQQINKQISQLRSQLGEASEDEAEVLGRLDEINNRKADVEAKASALQGQMDQAQAELDAATARLQEIETQVARAEADLKAASDALEASNDKMREQAVDAYMGGEPSRKLANFVLEATDMREISAASEYLHQVVADRRTIVEENRELEGKANDARLAIESARQQAEAERNVVAERQGQLLSQKGQLDALHAQVQSEADAQAKLVEEAEQKRGEFEAQIATLQQQSDNIAAMLRGISSTGPPRTPGKGVLASPVPGAAMTSPFGYRVHPIYGTVRLHAGQDYGVSIGTPIRGAAGGTVVSVGPVSGYGNYTCLSHGGGLATCYAHQSEFRVTHGQQVQRGQIIGLSGNTGNSTGPHLHFEVRVNGNPVDPMVWL